MDMQISKTFGISAAEALQAAKPANVPSFNTSGESSAAILSPVDQLDLSSEAQAVIAGGESQQAGRTERIAEIRRGIADGSYDSPERLTAALDRFLDLHG